MLVEARRETWRMIGEEFAAIVGIEDGTRFAHAAVAFEAYAVQVYQESKDPADIDALLASLRHVLTLIGKDELGADDPSQPHVSRQEPQSKTPSGGSK